MTATQEPRDAAAAPSHTGEKHVTSFTDITHLRRYSGGKANLRRLYSPATATRGSKEYFVKVHPNRRYQEDVPLTLPFNSLTSAGGVDWPDGLALGLLLPPRISAAARPKLGVRRVNLGAGRSQPPESVVSLSVGCNTALSLYNIIRSPTLSVLSF